MACVALPTCALALAESERFLPGLVTDLEEILDAAGLREEDIVIRMTGCPNGCARPYLAELAFVGKAPNKYQVYVGGNEGSTRLNRLYKDSVKGDEILGELRLLHNGKLIRMLVGDRQMPFGGAVAGNAVRDLTKRVEKLRAVFRGSV